MGPPPCGVRLEGICVVCEKSVCMGVVIAGAGGLAVGGHAAWEPIENRQLDSPDLLVSSSHNHL